MVGHSYGGTIITNAVNGNSNVRVLVYVSAFAPAEGESSIELANRHPDATLGAALAPPVVLSGGERDLFIDQEKFASQCAADVPSADAQLMAAAQRPIAKSALPDALGPPAWSTIPSWFIYGTDDLNIPAAALAFMAERAQSREAFVIDGASHVVMISHPKAVADLIERATHATDEDAQSRLAMA